MRWILVRALFGSGRLRRHSGTKFSPPLTYFTKLVNEIRVPERSQDEERESQVRHDNGEEHAKYGQAPDCLVVAVRAVLTGPG